MTLPTGVKQGPEFKVADGKSHDGGFVELFHGGWGDRQLTADVREDLRLLAATTSCRIAGLLLPLLCVSTIEHQIQCVRYYELAGIINGGESRWRRSGTPLTLEVRIFFHIQISAKWSPVAQRPSLRGRRAPPPITKRLNRLLINAEHRVHRRY